MIQVTEHSVAVPHLPEALRGFRVAHLTDLHRSFRTPDALLREAVQRANAACPDLVVLTGDYVTKDKADIAPCAEIIAGLQARLGIYAVLGNHDYGTSGSAVAKALTRSGVEVLTNRNVQLEGGLWLVGIDDTLLGHPDQSRAFAGIGPNAPLLILVHNPAYAEKLSDKSCIVLSGHTHGGQIRVPFLTAWKIRKIHAKHYLRGWFGIGHARLFVNRGLGNVGFSFRFRSKPEVAILTLYPEPQV